MKESIWITGANGMLGSALYNLIADDSTEIFTTDTDVDITDTETVLQYAAINRPNVIINCAAVTDPKYCEENRIEAYRVNALGARNAAVAARQINAKLIHISTDDIFEGQPGDSFNEFDTPTPKSIYARSKYAGELLVKELVPKHIIIRSSWIYAKNGGSFLNKVIVAARDGGELELEKNRIGSPTSAETLAGFIRVLIGAGEYGVFHAACEGSCTREEFAQAVLKHTGGSVKLIERSLSYRPTNAHIENLMMKLTGIYQMPAWEDALDKFFGGGANG